MFFLSRNQFGSVLGVLGGSGHSNRAPRTLFVILEWSTAQIKASGLSSDHFWNHSWGQLKPLGNIVGTGRNL